MQLGPRIISVCIGDGFTMFLDDIGNVFSCGYNGFGSLGIGNVLSDERRLPTKISYFVENNIKITKIKCGKFHVIVLDSNGVVYCWGDNQLDKLDLMMI